MSGPGFLTIKHRIAIITSIIFLLITVGITTGEGIASLDRMIILKVASFRMEGINGPVVDVTALGSRTLIITFYILTVSLFLALKKRKSALHLVIAGIGAGVLAPLIKMLVGRARPVEVEALVKVSGHSYPSGHSLAAAVFYFSLGLILTTFFESRSVRIGILMISVMIIAAVSLSRVYLGVHYPSDILGGTLLGMTWA